MSGEPVSRIPRGLHHLVSTRTNKFAGRLPSRLPHASTKFVQPRDRVRKWNIRPGDRVRLLSGTPKQKFLNEEDSSEGWKTFAVKQVDMARNRVFLEGVNNKKTNVIHKRPDNYDSLTEQQKKSYDDQKNFASTMRPVHYSNVQLCLENKDGVSSTFATRIKTAQTHFNTRTNRLDWIRLAAKISGPTDLAPDAEAPMIRWPKPDKKYEMPKPNTDLDTSNNMTRRDTLVLPDVGVMKETLAAELFPQHINAPAPTDLAFSDAYIHELNGTGKDPLPQSEAELVDMLMPLYLSEELAPRFAKNKTYKAYRARREAEELERTETGRAAVRAWEAGGRDRGLKEAMELEEVGLEGVFLRSRTRKEVREAAEAEYDVNNEASRRDVNMAVRMGKVWNAEQGRWVAGPKAEKIARSRSRKARKERKVLEKLANLKIAQDENTVLPRGVQAA
ncbi:hypothetical protein IAU60_000392 [Kwoniella sp. DSM 27419]